MSTIDLSIIIPSFNEGGTIESVVSRVLKANVLGLKCEVIVIDDGSQDDTGLIVKRLKKNHSNLILISHEKNKGKGAAIRTGFSHASGNICLIQDADLEYNPEDYLKLLTPIVDDVADVVYGSRFKSGEAGRVLYFWHSIGNRFLTLLSNMFTNINLTDMETGYKVFRKQIIDQIIICEDRFGFEPEITAKIVKLRPQPKIYEVGISYFGRTYEEGKKIGWKDGIRSIYCIFKYNL